MAFDHGGQIYTLAAQQGLSADEALTECVDFSASIAPWFFAEAPHFNPLALLHYPDSTHQSLINTIQNRFQIDRDCITVSNGISSAILNLFAYLRPKNTVLYTPIFGEYERVALSYGSKIQRIERLSQTQESAFSANSIEKLAQIPIAKNSLVVWVNPSTPDGRYVSLQELKPLFDLWQQQDCWVLLDESFLPFISFDPKISGRSLLDTWPKLIVLQSLTKYYACPGLRVGAVFAHPDFLTQWPQAHWPVSAIDQALLLQRMQDHSLESQNHILQTQLKTDLIRALQESPLVKTIYPGQVNFILVKTRIKAQVIQQALAKTGILVRDCQNFGLGDYSLRLAVKDEASHNRLLASWSQLEDLTQEPITDVAI
ncbi:threonine-phosphate decarboxylase [Thiomicrorhabdus immobilis]|uniref:histidinol-phosphate transaminase n=1 Tax=Thiomicrorhabdus immobilis TaxID=2791037 RepID=A0ABM7MCS0_9GAMM|nr:aminotransferase class I/II-fold pyridoxal phosphate-dependent enzyme [Thiomicrorhabdus immobilis]BCN93195.1 threonine-phosphate decarboxylase [Thiomicrorhabdus immobilis]